MTTIGEFSWRFQGINEEGETLAALLARTLGLSRSGRKGCAVQRRGQCKTISIKVLKRTVRWRDYPQARAGQYVCRVGPAATPKQAAFQLTRIAHVMANDMELNGGLLVHGALAERDGAGVILAGPGGVGKTTASHRLPHPWRSLSDDATLIVRAADDTYRSHPWPTWSRFRQDGAGGSCDAHAAVNLVLICMLTQGAEDRIERLSSNQAISELVDVSGQAVAILNNGLDPDALRRLNLMRFRNALEICKNLPICRLAVSRRGPFWDEIEKFLPAIR